MDKKDAKIIFQNNYTSFGEADDPETLNMAIQEFKSKMNNLKWRIESYIKDGAPEAVDPFSWLNWCDEYRDNAIMVKWLTELKSFRDHEYQRKED